VGQRPAHHPGERGGRKEEKCDSYPLPVRKNKKGAGFDEQELRDDRTVIAPGTVSSPWKRAHKHVCVLVSDPQKRRFQHGTTNTWTNPDLAREAVELATHVGIKRTAAVIGISKNTLKRLFRQNHRLYDAREAGIERMIEECWGRCY
jgi:hypothetical protein